MRILVFNNRFIVLSLLKNDNSLKRLHDGFPKFVPNFDPAAVDVVRESYFSEDSIKKEYYV